MSKPKRLDFTPEQVEALISRLENQNLEPSDFPLLANILRAMIWMESSLKEKSLSIARLKAVFGIKTESAKKLRKLLDNAENHQDPKSKSENTSEDESKNNPENTSKEISKDSGHGHRHSSDYTEARVISIAHETLKKGAICPACGKGKLFNLSPGTVIRIVGQPWLIVDIYKPERLRCSTCQKIFTAKLPAEFYTEGRCDKTAKAIVSIMKYRGGVPFYRQEQIQSLLGNPISDTEIWKMTHDVAGQAEPIFAKLCELAANADCIHNDDTTARILELMKDNEKEKPDRTGIFTTAILAKIAQDKQIALFFTGRKHAGENLNDILHKREIEKPPPIQSCDALNHNKPKDHSTHQGYCNAHLRRKFYEIAECWPKECLRIISCFNIVFLNDRFAKMKNLDPEERLKWHQEKSAPIMDQIKAYCTELVETKQVEPNSSFGKAIKHLENYWEGYTLFLRIPLVPISNNDDERLIKRAILNRKNSYFFKSEAGAKIADVLMSIIETCALNNVNPYDYLLAIQQHSDKVFHHPERYLPWNYKEAI